MGPETILHQCEEEYYNSEMCIKDGKLTETQTYGYPLHTLMIIRPFQGYLPDLFAMFFYCYQYLIKKNLDHTQSNQCTACEDDMYTEHTCLGFDQTQIDIIGQSLTLAQTGSFMIKVLSYINVDCTNIDMEIITNAMTSLGIADYAIDSVKMDAREMLHVNRTSSVTLFNIPPGIMCVFSVVYKDDEDSNDKQFSNENI